MSTISALPPCTHVHIVDDLHRDEGGIALRVAHFSRRPVGGTHCGLEDCAVASVPAASSFALSQASDAVERVEAMLCLEALKRSDAGGVAALGGVGLHGEGHARGPLFRRPRPVVLPLHRAPLLVSLRCRCFLLFAF